MVHLKFKKEFQSILTIIVCVYIVELLLTMELYMGGRIHIKLGSCVGG